MARVRGASGNQHSRNARIGDRWPIVGKVLDIDQGRSNARAGHFRELLSAGRLGAFTPFLPTEDPRRGNQQSVLPEMLPERSFATLATP